MELIQNIQAAVARAVAELYQQDIAPSAVQIAPTSTDFEGDFTVVTFPFVKIARKSPEAAGQEIGEFIQKNLPEIGRFNVIKGFLNLSIADGFWKGFLSQVVDNKQFGRQPRNGRRVMVEFSSPNTNKPLHLGHVRNICLGWSCAQILDAAGFDVVKAQIINDRGIAICKSMVAWRRFGEGKTPAMLGQKGDHVVGDFYVLFEKKSKEEYSNWQKTAEAADIFEKLSKEGQSREEFFAAFKNRYFNEHSQLGAEARDLLQRWEAGDTEAIDLWKMMNGWVYSGFDETYRTLGVSFDKLYYESDTYLLGKEIIDDGLAKQVFFKKPDSSVWVDLTAEGLDEKLLLRSDGTSVYMTQDLGTARMRWDEMGCEKTVYVVADEQNYHFQALFKTLKKLGEPYADGLYHLNYGMVELPTGRMKSREGTVVDADDLVAEVIKEVKADSLERSEMADFSPEEKEETWRRVGLAALKFFILKVGPRKKMIFDPTESVDIQGQTGPYIQYSFVRINSLMGRVEREGISLAAADSYGPILPQEKALLGQLFAFPGIVGLAAESYDPSQVAHWCYEMAKDYHKFWHDLSVFNAVDEAARAFRLKGLLENGRLEVAMHRGRFQLLSNNSIYSWDDLYVNYVRAFELFDFEKFKPKEVLVLGLGLGSVPFMLEKKFGQRPHFTCVELDEIVAEWAFKYTFSRMESTVEVITADASLFVETCEEQFDLLVMDIFIDDLVPTVFEETYFLEECARLLAPGGFLLYNRLYQTDRDRLATERFFEGEFRLVFPDGFRLNTTGNWILMNKKPVF